MANDKTSCWNGMMVRSRCLTVLALSFLICHLTFSRAAAQDEPEYRMEAGGGLGLTAYQGDFNGSPLKGMQPMLAAVAKFKMNPRMALAAQLGFSSLKGSSREVETWYPELHDNPVDFKTSITDFSLRYEYNFWPFGTGKEYLGAKPLTPFIALGAGLCFTGKPKLTQAFEPTTPTEGGTDDRQAVVAHSGTMAAALLVGAGVKYKLRDRLNLTAEWVMHFTGSDKLDGMKDLYGIKSSGMFKNTDCYSTLQISLTYDFWERCKTCNNDR